MALVGRFKNVLSKKHSTAVVCKEKKLKLNITFGHLFMGKSSSAAAGCVLSPHNKLGPILGFFLLQKMLFLAVIACLGVRLWIFCTGTA